MLAKRIATVDVLSKGRVRMCLGVGWMDEELRATGADPRTRGVRMDETIEAMRVLWADSGPDGAAFDGAVRLASTTPTRSPSRSDRAACPSTSEATARLRPAGPVDWATASSRSGSSADELALRIAQMREAAEQAGRDPDAIELSVSGYLPTMTEEEVAAAEVAGIDRMLLSTSMSQDLDGLADEIDAFAARFGPLVVGRSG